MKQPAAFPIHAMGALEQQDMLVRFWRSQRGAKYMIGWLKARRDAQINSFGTKGSDVVATAAARAYMEAATLETAETFWISREMAQLAEHAAETMPDQPFIASDLPSPKGFIIFPEAIMTTDARGKGVAIIAYSWSMQTMTRSSETESQDVAGVVVSVYSDTWDPRDAYFGNENKLALDLKPGETWNDRLMLLVDYFSAFDEMPEEVPTDHPVYTDTEAIRQGNVYIKNLPKALFTLMGQTLAAREVQSTRGMRRNLAKTRSRIKPEVTMITLRRLHTESDAGDGGVEWTRRWVVRGHWRRQWLPSIRGHRLQWIAPFVKGPDDKPLVVSRKVHVLQR